MALLASSSLSVEVLAQGVMPAHYDLAASGFVTPAGMPPVATAGMSAAMGPMGMGGSPVMPVNYNGYGCDSGACDGMPMQQAMDRRVCGTCGGGGGCGCNGILGGGGLLGKFRQGGGLKCFFCRGAGCTACKELPFGYCGAMFAECLKACGPWEGAEICNQRWYDISLEALFLDRNVGGSIPGVLTTQGVSGTPVLSLGDVGSGDLEAGVRVSIATICGAGGNLEMTYMGGNEWSGGASATSATPTLYSFISEFGTNPSASGPGVDDAGFDDTDRSFTQSVGVRSEFHSAELNYRRRTMFPYCRFQNSWLVGLRYLRYSDSLAYSALGDTNNTGNNNGLRFFDSNSGTKNNIFGPQVGYDFWWNTFPGLSLGIGSKFAWMQNDVDRRVNYTANSAGIGATPGGATIEDGGQKGVGMADFEFKLVYRFSRSLALRSSYYALAADNVAFGGLDAAAARDILQGGTAAPSISYENLTLQGFTIGAEYMW